MGLSFAADWLGLREPADHAARAPAVTAAAAAHLRAHPAPLVVDLGCGRGSNLRFLQPHLPAATRWRLVDNDAALLRDAARALPPASDVELCARDLRDPGWTATLAGADLVTAAALLDLVGAAWLAQLVDAVGAAGAALLVTGSVDGRVSWTPAHHDDAAMAAAYEAHQGGDKGFGPALGTAAPAALEGRLRAQARRVVAADADWREIAEPRLQAAYLDGVVAALAETGLAAARITAWARARRTAIAAGESRLTVGHRDVFAERVA